MKSQDRQDLDWYIAGLSFVGFAFFVCLVIAFGFCAKSIKHKKQINLTVASTALISVFITLFWIGGDWLRIFLAFGVDSQDNTYVRYQWLIITNLVTYYVAELFLYVALILRAYYFSQEYLNSPLSACERKFFFIVLIIDVFAIIWYIIAIHNAEDPKHAIFRSKVKGLTLIMTGITVVINDVLINFGLLYLMLTRLYRYIYQLQEKYEESQDKFNKISSDIHNNNHTTDQRCGVNTLAIENGQLRGDDLQVGDGDDDQESEDMDFNDAETQALRFRMEQARDDMSKNSEEQEDKVDLITKLSVLTIYCATSALIFGIATFYTVYEFAKTKHSTSWMNKHVMVDQMLCEIQAITNCLVLYFMFVFGDNQFARCICCKCCYKCLRKCCKYCVKKKVVEIRKQRLNDNIHGNGENNNHTHNEVYVYGSLQIDSKNTNRAHA